MRFGPHSLQVEALLDALTQPALRRRGRRRGAPSPGEWRFSRVIYQRVLAADRLEMWDDARMTAALVAAPAQVSDAAGAALALVASDLIDDSTWRHFTDTPLARLVELRRPGGVLAERCPCDHQLGERLVAAKLAGTAVEASAGPLAVCGCVTPSLPSAAAVEIAFGLVSSWEGPDWESLVDIAVRLA
ncbi:MAG: hypothetical protein ACLGI8_07895 [Acidimicrobiia bacterium]